MWQTGHPPRNIKVISKSLIQVGGLAVSIQRGGVEPLCLRMCRKTEQYIFVCMYLKLRIVFVGCLLLPLNLLSKPLAVVLGSCTAH